MDSRRFIGKTFPEGLQALNALDIVIRDSGIDKWHQELIKIRSSQLNGCAFCLDKHVQDAILLGIDTRKINLVAAWKEAKNHFTDEEQLILLLTEEITMIHNDGLSDGVYADCVTAFGEALTGQMIMAATVINAWNRIGVGFKMQPKF